MTVAEKKVHFSFYGKGKLNDHSKNIYFFLSQLLAIRYFSV